MAVRPSMANLILRVRRLIFDMTDPKTYTDQEIQDELDRYRVYHRFITLRPELSYNPGGLTHYHDYFSGETDWEEDVQLFDSAFNPILAYPTGTLDTQDFITGHWTFKDNANASPIPMPLGQIPIVRLLGQNYDIWCTAADLLEMQSAIVDVQFDFGTNQQSFRRSQQFEMMNKLANTYRGKAKPHFVPTLRVDQLNADWSGIY